MIWAVLSGVAEQPPQNAEDWWARGLALLGLIVSALMLVHAYVEGRRKRAANFPATVREHVQTLLNILVGATQRSERLDDLNTVVSSVRIEDLRDATSRIADRTLSRRLDRFTRAVAASRVGQRPDSDAPLTTAQMEQVQLAISCGKQVMKRLDSIARGAPG